MSILKPRKATIPIYQGDDSERLAELRMAVAIAERRAAQAAGPRRGGDPEPSEDVKAAQAAYDAYVDEAAERAVEVVVSAIGKKRFRDLVAAHPPRMVTGEDGKETVHDDDFEYGVNVETFAPALLTFEEVGEDEDDTFRTIVGPAEAIKSPKVLARFLDDEVTDGDYEKLFLVAYGINRAPGSDPKELRYSPSTSGISG